MAILELLFYGLIIMAASQDNVSTIKQDKLYNKSEITKKIQKNYTNIITISKTSKIQSELFDSIKDDIVETVETKEDKVFFISTTPHKAKLLHKYSHGNYKVE